MVMKYKDLISVYDNNILEEASINTSRSNFKYKIWVDPAGNNRGRADKQPRIKIFNNGKMIPILIPTNIGDRPSFDKHIKNKYISSKDIKPIFDFISEYNDIFLMCYYLEGDIFKTNNNYDTIIRSIMNEIINNDRDIAIKNLIKKYNLNIEQSEFVPYKYRHLANNF